MSVWSDIPLVEMCVFSSGKAIKPGQEGLYKAFGSNGVIGASTEARHNKGIIIGRVGAYCGSVAVSYEPFWASDNTIVIEPKEETDLNFLYYLLRDAQLNQYAGGSAQPLVTQTTLKSLTVRVPIAEQRARIGATLRTFDDLIENSRRRIELLESMARAIYREWFVHFRFPGHEDVPLVDSDLGPIPEGWVVKCVGDFAELSRTSLKPSDFPDEVFDHLSIPAFDEDGLPSQDLGSSIRSNKYVVEGPAVLVSKLNPRIERTWFVVPGETRRSISSTEFLIMRPLPGLSLEWLYLMMRSKKFQTKLPELSGGTSTSHQRIKPEDFLKINELVPTTDVMMQFTKITAPVLGESRQLIRLSEQLRFQRDLLLPKLVSGEIDVSDLEIDLSELDLVS